MSVVQFDPDLVLVACGLDAARGDPLVSTMAMHAMYAMFTYPQGRYNITPEGYAHMTHQLCGLAEGRVVLALEVGSN